MRGRIATQAESNSSQNASTSSDLPRLKIAALEVQRSPRHRPLSNVLRIGLRMRRMTTVRLVQRVETAVERVDSTFSCDIAYSDSPTASRACSGSRNARSRRPCLAEPVDRVRSHRCFR